MKDALLIAGSALACAVVSYELGVMVGHHAVSDTSHAELPAEPALLPIAGDGAGAAGKAPQQHGGDAGFATGQASSRLVAPPVASSANTAPVGAAAASSPVARP